MTAGELRKALEGVPDDAPVVVFAKSPGIGWIISDDGECEITTSVEHHVSGHPPTFEIKVEMYE